MSYLFIQCLLVSQGFWEGVELCLVVLVMESSFWLYMRQESVSCLVQHRKARSHQGLIYPIGLLDLGMKLRLVALSTHTSQQKIINVTLNKNSGLLDMALIGLLGMVGWQWLGTHCIKNKNLFVQE
jgi:hypothetical protein